jgi:hydroxyacylglutathione hydrolase
MTTGAGDEWRDHGQVSKRSKSGNLPGLRNFHDCAAAKRSWIDAVNLYVLPAGPIQTNAYLLTAPERGEAVLIDAPGGILAEIEPMLQRDKCRLVELWLTHGHWDHTQGGAEVVRKTKAVVRAHADDRAMIETPEVMERFMGEKMNLQPIHVDHWIKQGDRFNALGTTVEVRHVPGHCPGNVLFYFSDLAGAFVGDALFNGSIGRTDLPGGSFELLEKSIREQIYSLPDSTVVYPGHGPKTTVGDEKAGNPYVTG